ncbi:MAG: Digeranylgeranylglycerophospholipid reductase [Methanoregula sp. PtaU1.Bin051]|nr:MAG: Digeranylgeranylglycerophospholipid reductase [Methanoregula sp. PtaU1.Bin051]
MYDVIIAGAGPAGSAAAQACAKAGLSTLVIEEHGTIGYPIQCAGLLSLTAFGECGVSKRSILNTVTGAKVTTSMGSNLVFDAGKPKAYVVDRGMLDFEMAQAAADTGAEFHTKTSVCGISKTTLRTRGIHGRKEYSFRILIAADGPRSTVARLLGMQRAKLYLAGIQADVPFTMDENLAGIYPDAAPDFFGYAIPLGKNRARIGLCSGQNAKERFAAFSRQFADKKIHLVTGTVPLGVMPRTYGHRTLFTGDAGGFAKPISGGGVYTGIRSARHAAAVAVSCCEQDRFDDTALSSYETLWKDDIGGLLESGYRFFRLRRRLFPEDIDRLIRALNDPEIINLILQYGDMDRPSKLLKQLMLNPAVIGVLGSLVRPKFFSLFRERSSGNPAVR